MKPILLHSNLSLANLIMSKCFEKHNKTLYVDCNSKPALYDLANMKILQDASTIFLHNYPASTISDFLINNFRDKQFVFSCLNNHAPADVVDFNLSEYSHVLPSKLLTSLLTNKLTALININFLIELEVSYAKPLREHYDRTIATTDLKLHSYLKKHLKTA